jgi:hypothetical protein
MTEFAEKKDTTESALYRTTVHWAILFGPAMLFIIGGVSLRSRTIPALVLLGIAILWGILSIRNLRMSEFVLTDSKFVARIGFPLTRRYELPYTELAGADFIKPALGVMLGFGKIMILRKDNKAVVFRLVSKPDDLAEKLKQEIIRAHAAPQAEDPAP